MKTTEKEKEKKKEKKKEKEKEKEINYFAKLPKDIIIYIAMMLEKHDIISYCNTCKKFDNMIYQNKQFWTKMLKRDFDIDYYKTDKSIDPHVYYDISILKNNYKELDETIEQIYQLKTLNLSWAEIDVPKEIGQLVNLQQLYMHYSQIKEIPIELGQLTNLQVLDFNHNRIEEIPPELGRLSNLKSLYLYRNKIKEIPKELGQLTNLETLDLRYNQLKTLPKELGQLTKLKTFDMRYNQLGTLPLEIQQLTIFDI